MPVGEMGLNGANRSINRGLPAMSAVTETSGELWERVTEACGLGEASPNKFTFQRRA